MAQRTRHASNSAECMSARERFRGATPEDESDLCLYIQHQMHSTLQNLEYPAELGAVHFSRCCRRSRLYAGAEPSKHSATDQKSASSLNDFLIYYIIYYSNSKAISLGLSMDALGFVRRL